MAEVQVRAHINMLGNKIVSALMDPQVTDPTTPSEGQIWVNTTTDKLMLRIGGANKAIAFLTDVTAGSINSSLWDAQSVVVAVADNNPLAVVIPEGGVLGRTVGGDVGPLTTTQLKSILSIPAGSIANQTYVDNAVATAVSNLLNGAGAAYDTLQELATLIQSNDSDIATALADIATKVDKYATTIGDGSALTLTIVHNFGTTDVQAMFRLVSDDEPVIVDWRPVSNTAIEAKFNTAPALNEIRVVVHG